jgi:hypothetical protein
MGDGEGAVEAADAAIEEARALRQPYNIAHALCSRTLVRLFQHQTSGLDRLLDELADLTAEHEIAFYAAVCDILRARRTMLEGDVEAGCAALAAGMVRYDATRSMLYRPTWLMWRADGLRRAGQVEEGLQVVAEARALMAETDMANDLAEVARVEGDLRLAGGDRAGAALAYEEASQIAERQGARLFADRAQDALRKLKLSDEALA